MGMPRCPHGQHQGSLGGCRGTYRRFSSGRPRKAPGWTVLIRLFLRSLRGDGHRPQGVQQGSIISTSPAPSPTLSTATPPRKSLLRSFPSHFPLGISPKGAGKA